MIFWPEATRHRRVLIVLTWAACVSSAYPDDPVNIGSRRELFVDSYLIQSMNGADLRLHHPRPAETVLRFDEPWEGKYCGYVTVIRDADRYRMYYRGLPEAGRDGSDTETTCYAESEDGIRWTKPKLGLHEARDASGAVTRDNNIILAGNAPYSHNFAPFLDTNPDADPSGRFKALAGTGESGLAAFASPDGVTWLRLREQPVLTEGAFDSQNVSFWSEAERCYLAYFRTWSGGGFKGFRTVSRSRSADFLEWTSPGEMTYGTAPPEHIYTNQTRPYFRAPHIYISTAARFMPGRRVVSAEEALALGGDERYSGDCSDTVLMTSRGGEVYDRTFMEAFVRPGPGLGNWTSRTNYPAHGIVPTGEGEMSMYIQRNYGQPDHSLQRMVLRTDGMASLHAGYAGGEMTTRPLIIDGDELVINYSTSAAGEIRFGLLDESGAPVGGFGPEDSPPVIGDMIERTVRWKSGTKLPDLEGRPVRLRVLLRDADLYSFQIR